MSGISIYDLRKMAKGMSLQDSTSHIMPNVVPSVKQMMEAKKKAEKDIFDSMSEEQKDAEIRKNMPLSEMLSGLRDFLKNIYDKSSFVLLGYQPRGADHATVSIEYSGEEKDMGYALGVSMMKSEDVKRVVNHALAFFIESCPDDEVESRIVVLQDIIRGLNKRNDVNTQIALKKAEVKRMRKVGRLDLAELKEKEIRQIIEKEEKRKKHKAQAIEALVKARAAKVEKKRREEAMKKERERQQPNFAKMAKKKMQKIAERKAEKRKKSAGGDEKIKSCSMFSNVG